MITLDTVHGAWPFVLPDIKVKLRARLPGASAFDDAAAGLRQARAKGVPASALLAPAMAGSWLVNSQVASPVIQKWLAGPTRKEWVRLVAALESESPAVDEIEGALAAIVQAGGSLGAISKVLSLVCLRPVPLMPDAALAHVLRVVPVPAEPDAQTAPVKHFLPMLDRFLNGVATNEEDLAALAKANAPGLSPADMLDRLLWFDSVGYRHFKNDQGGWYWLRLSRTEAVEGSEIDEAVVFVRGAPPEGGVRPTACIDIPAEDDFSARALEAFTEAARS